MNHFLSQSPDIYSLQDKKTTKTDIMTSMFLIAGIFLFALKSLFSQELYKAPAEGTETRFDKEVM